MQETPEHSQCRENKITHYSTIHGWPKKPRRNKKVLKSEQKKKGKHNPSLWDTAKAVLRGRFIPLTVFIKKWDQNK